MRKTTLEVERERSFQEVKDKYYFVVTNSVGDLDIQVVTEYDTIEATLHKVKLDIITNATLDLSDSSIVVELKVK